MLNDLPQIWMIRILILSGPWALSGFKFWTVFKISSWEKLIDVSDWSVRGAKFVWSLLLFCNIEHCSAKKWVKKFCFLVKIGHKITVVV